MRAVMQLRDYEQAIVEKLHYVLTVKRSALVVSPTGSGKTVMAAAFIQSKPQARVLWVAHRIELLNQARRELIRAGVPASEIGMLSGGHVDNDDARVIVASLAMFRRGAVPEVDIIVFDEAHRAMAKTYQRIIAASAGALVLGLTATPWRLDGQPLSDVFEDMIVAATPTQLEAAGHIARLVTYGIPKDKAEDLVRGIATHAGDYAQGQLGSAMMRGTLMGDVVSEAQRLAPGQRTIVFAATREHGKALAARFAESGRPTEYLDGQTYSDVRQAMVGPGGRFDIGETQVVVNVDVLSEGYDCPAVKCIVMARPTKSLTRFLQYAGRAARPCGRERPVILDHAGNCWRFGLPNAERDWSLEGRERGMLGVAPVKLCNGCGAMVPCGCKECPECGSALREDESVKRGEDVSVQLERLRATHDELARREGVLRALAAMKGLNDAWVERALAEAS